MKVKVELEFDVPGTDEEAIQTVYDYVSSMELMILNKRVENTLSSYDDSIKAASEEVYQKDLAVIRVALRNLKIKAVKLDK